MSVGHVLPYIVLTSISTPVGKVKSLNDSINRGLELGTSINLLCTLISYCSLASLCTKVDLLTVYLLVSVGKGTGPIISTDDR